MANEESSSNTNAGDAVAPGAAVSAESPAQSESRVRVSPALKDAVSVKQRDDKPYVSPVLVASAAWGWRMIVVVIVAALIVFALGKLSTVVVPTAIALLLTVLLQPLHRFFVDKLRFPSALSAVVSILALLGALVGLIAVAGTQIAAGISELSTQAVKGFNELIKWAEGAPLNLDLGTLESYWNDLTQNFQQYLGTVLDGALSVTTTVGHAFAGILIAFFCTIFFLMDGRQIWTWLVGLLPRHVRERTHQAGRRGLVTLSSYVRTQILVAFIDATGIALGAAALGIPLAVPLAALVFLGAFVPFVGAIVTGSVAVLVALVAKGWIYALLMLAVVLVVQQIEGHLLQPLLMGHAVALHPVAVLLSVTAGTVLAGIVGALFAVPVVAVLNTVVQYFHGHDKFPELGFDDHIAIRPSAKPAYMVVSASKYVSGGRWDDVPETEDKGSEILDRIVARFQNRTEDTSNADETSTRTDIDNSSNAERNDDQGPPPSPKA